MQGILAGLLRVRKWAEFNKILTFVRSEFAGKYVDFREAVQRLAIMDCICSLATLAKNPTYTRPVFTEKQQVRLFRKFF